MLTSKLILILIVSLLLHHRCIHSSDKDKTETEKWFQISDISNHETWIMVLTSLLIFKVVYNL